MIRCHRLSHPASPLLYLVILLCSACGGPQQVELSGPTMGTQYHVTLRPLPQDYSAESLQAAIDRRLAEINRIMSTYDPDSELSRLNENASTDWVRISDALSTVLTEARRISVLSDGVFDVTVGPLVNLWGFGPRRGEGRIPDEAAIAAARERVGYRMLKLRADPPAVRKARPDLYIDLSAIAKGYGVDQVAELLEAAGVTDYLVEIGGELRTRGVNVEGRPWQIGIEKPAVGERTVQEVIGLSGQGMATSGDYRNFFEIDGQRYAHVIDPTTGWPVRHRLASVSVLDPSCMTADGFATALLALGPERGYALAEREQLAALFIVITPEGRFEEHATMAFQPDSGDGS